MIGKITSNLTDHCPKKLEEKKTAIHRSNLND